MLKFARLTTVIAVAAAAYFAGYLGRRAPAPAAAARQVLYYTCPMHPQYKSDRAGNAPCCGMRLEAVYAGGGDRSDPAATAMQGTVQISPATQQLIGVRTEEARMASASQLLRVPGRIAVDDERVYRLNAAADGWVRELGRNSAGSLVKQDQLLASYYTPSLLAAEQTFLLTLQNYSQLQQNGGDTGRLPANFNLQIAGDSLRSLGMNDLQMAEIREKRAAAPQINIYAPVTGFVIARGISPRQRFEKGSELYRIADLSHVWVLADIFEKDREFAMSGTIATVLYRGRNTVARISNVLPQFDSQSRTFKTRLEIDNPGYILRPDMFVDIELRADVPAALTVPADAITDSGSRKTVFVDRGSGVFEPRLVETGWRLGDRVQITSGLDTGQRIVVSGNFLLDSESRMKVGSAMARKAAIAKDPVCQMNVDPEATGTLKSERGGTVYYFCSDRCKKAFQSRSPV